MSPLGFFDHYPVFYEDSTIGSKPNRLNNRYKAIIESNKDIIQGATVLDIASHDGRWSLAALASGAKSVMGVEPRGHLVGKSRDNLSEFGERFEVRQADIFDVIHGLSPCDVVMCLGFLYHTDRHAELIGAMCKIARKAILIDSEIVKTKKPIVKFKKEGTAGDGDAHGDGAVVVGTPSLSYIRMALGMHGFVVSRRYPWQGSELITPDHWPELRAYRLGKRATFVATKGG